jgi:hypothetical protein
VPCENTSLHHSPPGAGQPAPIDREHSFVMPQITFRSGAFMP